jgi:hypothetical protein
VLGVQLQAAFIETAWEKEKEHITCVLFRVQKTYEEKFPKMAKMTKKSLKVQKYTEKLTP